MAIFIPRRTTLIRIDTFQIKVVQDMGMLIRGLLMSISHIRSGDLPGNHGKCFQFVSLRPR
jgi:hypothetical protein